MGRLTLIVGAVLIGAAGCAPPANREALTKEALKADPAFAQLLDKHREMVNRIDTYQRELALKRSTIERTIAQMRKDLADAEAGVRTKVDETKKKIEPDRERLELTLSMALEKLRTKQSQRASLGRSMTHLKKAAKSREASWTPEERARQQAQLDELTRDAARLDQELAGIREHVRLLKIKLLLLRF